jgi:hypothetical protein
VEKQWYRVTMADEDNLSAFLSLCLDRATSFLAYFPEDPYLGSGKEVFCSLPRSSVTVWDGMANCAKVTAPLDFVSKELLRCWMASTEERNPLWQYELRDSEEVFFRAEDFSLYMVFASSEEMLAFRQRGIDTSMWEPIDLKGQEGIVAEQWSDEEIQQLRDDLEPKE